MKFKFSELSTLQQLISLKVSSKRITFHCNFYYKHCNYKNQSKKHYANNKSSQHGCISGASLRRLTQRLRDLSGRADLQISKMSLMRSIKDVSSEMPHVFLETSLSCIWDCISLSPNQSVIWQIFVYLRCTYLKTFYQSTAGNWSEADLSNKISWIIYIRKKYFNVGWVYYNFP